MNSYYLISNMLYNAKHVMKKRWYHKLLGKPSNFVAEVEASDKATARKYFKDKGYNFGFFQDWD